MKPYTLRISRAQRALATLFLVSVLLITGCGPTDEHPKVLAVKGQTAPDFALTDLKGKNWTLSELRGKVVFVNFWATWCPPCIKELPSMQALKNRIPNSSFQMLTILYNDRPELGQSLVIKSGYDFPVLIDPNSTTGKQYGLTGVPETFIIDRDGILREKFIGPYDWNSPGAMEIINKYLPQ